MDVVSVRNVGLSFLKVLVLLLNLTCWKEIFASRSNYQEAAEGETMRSETTRSSFLVLVISSQKNAHMWNDIRHWGKTLRPATVLIAAGAPYNIVEPLHDPYHLSLATGILTVNDTIDTYSTLALKVVRSFLAIAHAPELARVSHVLKIDDTKIFQWRGFDAALAHKALVADSGDYFTSGRGYLVGDCSVPRNLFRKKTTQGYWHERPYVCRGTFVYASGGAGYILSRRALAHIDARWPYASLEDFAHWIPYEDLSIGLTLREAGIKLVAARVEGIPFWDDPSRCLCTPPCLHEESEDILMQINASRCYDNSAIHKCCYAPCREFKDLCVAGVVSLHADPAKGVGGKRW